MIRKAIISAACALATVLAAGCAVAPQKPPERVPGDYTYTREYTSRLIAREMRKHDVQGLSIALVDDQRVVWAQGFGFSDATKHVPAGPETVYQVGSISKLFTATSAMQLAEQGQLDIDRPVNAYLPGFSINSRFDGHEPITVRQLMTHHAGLPRDMLKGMWTADPEPFTRVLDHLQDEYQVYSPDTVFSYSNVGMTVLGQVVQQVAGRSFAPHLEESLLRPLAMTDSYFAPVIRAGAHDSKGYRKGREAPVTPLRDVPAGGLHASVGDLSKFMMMVFANGRAGERQIVITGTLAEMLRPQNAGVPLDLDFQVGLGWMLSGLGDINIRNAGVVAHHAGGTPLFQSQLILLPEHKLGVVVLGNSASARPVVDRVAVEALKLALEAKMGIVQPASEEWVAREDAVPEETLRAFAGHYTTLMGAAVVERHGDRLRAQVAGRTFNMVSHGDGWFGLRYRLFGLLPISLRELDGYAIRRSSVAGREVLIASDGHTRLLVGERLAPKAIPQTWRQRIGKYEVVNQGQDERLFAEPSLVMRDGFLLLRVRIPDGGESGEMVLEPLSDSEAVLLGALAGVGETIRAVQVDGVEMWRSSGYLFRRKPD
jgi:CubicO group peptidase (beta-lactamase class C family)